MTAATFGDFLRQADAHIEAAIAAGREETTNPAAAIRELHRVIATMARYLDDRVPFHAIEVIGRTDLGMWERAAIDARTAMRQAADSLNQATGLADNRQAEPEHGSARHLAAAATCLTAGRDLLHTHSTTTPHDLWEPRSEWAHAVISFPVTRALTGEIARWSRQLAPHASVLAAGAEELAVWEALQVATHWLWMAEAAVRPVQDADPVTADDLRLLRAIPAAHGPARRLPGSDESVAELCAGITVSAERLRAAIFGTAERAQWEPGATADTWRWTARAAAITGHASELLLRSLAGHSGLPASPALDEAQLRAAADAVAWSWATWHQVAVKWNELTTETRGQGSPAVTEIGDLILRMGRLAWDDPQWTPATARGASLRATTELTGHDPGPEAVLGAIHQAADALARVAARDREAVQIADRAGRLYVRTRSLPMGYDVPRPYATAPVDRVHPLLYAYVAAEQSSAKAADALGALAIAVEAPSNALTLARAAVHSHHNARPDTGDEHRTVDTPVADARGTRRSSPGPVEQAVRDLRVGDPVVLLRAVEIDTAGRTLIAQAQQVSGQSGARASNGGATRRPCSPAVRLAAQDTPRSPKPRQSGSARIPSSPAAPQRPRTKRTHQTSRH